MKSCINLYILSAYSDRFSGYDTFQEEFLKGMQQQEGFSLHVVIEEYPTKEIRKEKKEGISYIYIPQIGENRFEALESYLGSAIESSARMVFLSNFFPAIFNVRAIKKLFPHARLIHVVHDFPWLSRFMGNEKGYMDYILNGRENPLSPQDDRFIRYCTYDMMESFKSMDMIVSLCESTYHMLTNFYGISSEKIRLIRNGMADYTIRHQADEHRHIRQRYNLPLSETLVLLVGRLTYSKGTDRIGALLNCIDSSTKWRLVYAGADDIYKWIPADRAASVVPLGFRNRQEMLELYSAVDLGLFPSRHEQCSYSGIEFLMHDIPVIATPAYGVRDMFHAGNAIMVSDVHQQITEEDMEAKRGWARDSYLKHYTSEEMNRQYVSLITKSTTIL